MAKKNESELLEALEIEIDECNDKLNRLGKMRELYLKDEEEKGPPPAKRGRKPKAEPATTNGAGFPARRPVELGGSADEADGQ